MKMRRYTLSVHGIVEFTDRDDALVQLLLGERGHFEDRLEAALSELAEGYTEGVVVEMKLREDGS